MTVPVRIMGSQLSLCDSLLGFIIHFNKVQRLLVDASLMDSYLHCNIASL